MLPTILFAAVCFLAWSNGANDNSKGVASLIGSGTLGERSALWWGTGSTLAGSLASVFLAQGLLAAFSGKGLVPEEIAGGQAFLLAVAIGAGGTVLLATRFGFPISTTHALVGAIVGAGWLAAGDALDLSVLATTFVLPLLVSPILALLLAAALAGVGRRCRRTDGEPRADCLCLGELSPESAVVPVAEGARSSALRAGGMAVAAPAPSRLALSLDATERCDERFERGSLRLPVRGAFDFAHVASAGVVGFARGLNDTPKIAALLLVVDWTHVRWGLVVVAVAMAAGGLLASRRVAHTMGRRITRMDAGQGLAANLATGSLVLFASRFGVPVSTTHVSVGALFGIGLVGGGADRRVMGRVVASWVVTLPCAAVLATGVSLVAAWMG